MKSKKPPFDPDKLFERALTFHHAGRLKDAEGLYKTLLDYFPNQVEVLTPLGTLLLQHGKTEEGIKQLNKSIGINPNQPEAYYNLGNGLLKNSNFNEALACFDRAISLNPKDSNAFLNRGNTLKDMKRYAEALESYDQAVWLKPDLASALWNKSLVKILTGEYEEGWELYEWGWKCSERGQVRNFNQPLWLGSESIKGKTLLIHSEQGLGDVIQFCRYIPMVEKMGAKVILEVHSSLIPLLSSLEGNFLMVENGHELPYFDVFCPIMSLPLAFKTSINTIPNQVPYLYVNPDKKEIWKERFVSKIRPRIGLAWSGSKTNKNDRNRSIPLELFESLLKLPYEFHSLQKELTNHELAMISKLNNITLHHHELDDFSDTAALVNEMDLVISVDTSVAHLAGALGKQFWLMLPYNPDYRWMDDRIDNPWYPSATLYRQDKMRNWSTVISDISKSLNALFI